ncbi:C2 domain containing protein, partial [Trichomonas vaginalis G3]
DNSAPTEKKADPVVIHCTVVDAQGLPAMDLNGKADPFCALNVNGKGEPQKTQVVMKDKNPVWNQDFNIPVENPEKDKLYITVYDFDEGNDNDVIGFNRLPINDIKVGDAPVERTVELKKRHGIRPDRGVVHLKLSAFNPGEEPGAAPAAEHPVKSEVPPKAEFLDCTVVSASNLVKMDKHGLSDPYVVLKLNANGETQKTEVIKKELNPQWNQEFHFTLIDKKTDVLIIECYDWDDHNSHDLIGNAILELAQFSYDIPIEADVPLKKEGGHRKDRGAVHLKFTIHKDKTGESDDEKEEEPKVLTRDLKPDKSKKSKKPKMSILEMNKLEFFHGPVQKYTDEIYFRVYYEPLEGHRHHTHLDFNLAIINVTDLRYATTLDPKTLPPFLRSNVKDDKRLPEEDHKKRMKYPKHALKYKEFMDKNVKILPIVRTKTVIKCPTPIRIEASYYPDKTKYPDAPDKVVVFDHKMTIIYRGEQLVLKGIAFENGTSYEFDINFNPQNNFTMFEWIRSMPAEFAPRSDRWAAYNAEQPQEETYKGE